METFKKIEKYPSYLIGDNGTVKSIDRVVTYKTGKKQQYKGQILKQAVTSYGYLQVTLCEDSKRFTMKSHVLVAMAFLGHVPDGNNKVVNHKDFDKKNNNTSNLEVVTNRENSNQKHILSTSKYVGVSWHKNNKKWQSRIWINGKNRNIGYYNTEIAAHFAYQFKLKRLWV